MPVRDSMLRRGSWVLQRIDLERHPRVTPGLTGEKVASERYVTHMVTTINQLCAKRGRTDAHHIHH